MGKLWQYNCLSISNQLICINWICHNVKNIIAFHLFGHENEKGAAFNYVVTKDKISLTSSLESFQLMYILYSYIWSYFVFCTICLKIVEKAFVSLYCNIFHTKLIMNFWIQLIEKRGTEINRWDFVWDKVLRQLPFMKLAGILN